MKCCTGACHQGRTCPLRTVRIPTRRSWLSRTADAISELFVAAFDIPWVPLAVAIVAAIIVNS